MIKTGNRNFWIAQIGGWGLFALSNFILQYFAIREIALPLLNSSIIFASGILITSAYRTFIIKRFNFKLISFGRTLLIILLSTLFLTIAFLIIVGIVFYVFIEQRVLTGGELLGNLFMFTLLLLMWNMTYFLIHYLHHWKNAESDKWQLAAAMKEAELGHLKAQVNPHFTFNSINNIRALISVDPDKAKEMLLHFSDLFRYSLVHNDQQLATVREELEIVEKYLKLSKVQFEEKLHYQIIAPSAILEHKVPPMMIQLLVENAIKHGISELKNGGTVTIEVSETDKNLMLNA